MRLEWGLSVRPPRHLKPILERCGELGSGIMSLAKRPASSRQDHLVRLYWVIIDALHPSAPPGESPVRAWTVIGDRSADLPDVVVDGGSIHSTTKAKTPQGIPGGLMRLAVIQNEERFTKEAHQVRIALEPFMEWIASTSHCKSIAEARFFPGQKPGFLWGEDDLLVPDCNDDGSSHSTPKARTPQGIPEGLLRLEWDLSVRPLRHLKPILERYGHLGTLPSLKRPASLIHEAFIALQGLRKAVNPSVSPSVSPA